MQPERPVQNPTDIEKDRILSISPLTAVFLKGNPQDPDWALSVFRETDYIVQNIKNLVGAIETRGFVGIPRDQGNVVISMGYELVNQHNVGLFQKEITERLIKLRWMRPDALGNISSKPDPEGIARIYLTSGIFYRGLFELQAV